MLTWRQGCNRRLDPLLAYPAWVRRTVPTGISNDAMGAVPQHPFFLRVIESLQSYDRNWLLPYITVMYSTGPLFLSVIWKEYMRGAPGDAGRVRVLMQDEYNRFSWSFFTHHTGNSWHGKDAQLIFWVGFFFLCGMLDGIVNVLLDGKPLAAAHCAWIYSCRCCWNLPVVGVWPDPPSGAVPLSLHQTLSPDFTFWILAVFKARSVAHRTDFYPSHKLETGRRGEWPRGGILL